MGIETYTFDQTRMSELLLTLLLPVRHFAFHPIPCAILASVFSACMFLPESSRRMRAGFLVSALCWWAFTYLEYGTSLQTNIRVDLVFLAPLFQIAAYFGIWLMFRWWSKNW